MSGSTITSHASHASLTDRTAQTDPPDGVAHAARSLRTLRIGLLGHGTVGRAFTRLVAARRERLRDELALELRIETVLVRDAERPRDDVPDGATLVDSTHEFLTRDHDLVVEALGGHEPAGALVARALMAGTPVATANKALLAERGDELLQIARAASTVLRAEAAIAAGVPLLGVLQHALRGATFDRIDAILNGTSNFVLSTVSARECSLDEAVALARRLGYCEADPALDLSGTDASQKLQILLAALRQPACVPDVRSIRRVDADDARVARSTGHVLRPVAHATLTHDGPACWVGPAAVPRTHALAHVDGVANAVLLRGGPAGEVLLAGPGAGGDATAIALLDDVLAIVERRGSYALPRTSAPHRVPAPASPWLVTLGPAPRGPKLDETLDFVAEEGLQFRTLHEVELPSGPVLAGVTRPVAAPVIERATSTVLTVGAVRTARAFRALPATA